MRWGHLVQQFTVSLEASPCGGRIQSSILESASGHLSLQSNWPFHPEWPTTFQKKTPSALVSGDCGTSLLLKLSMKQLGEPFLRPPRTTLMHDCDLWTRNCYPRGSKVARMYTNTSGSHRPLIEKNIVTFHLCREPLAWIWNAASATVWAYVVCSVPRLGYVESYIVYGSKCPALKWYLHA